MTYKPDLLLLARHMGWILYSNQRLSIPIRHLMKRFLMFGIKKKMGLLSEKEVVEYWKPALRVIVRVEYFASMMVMSYMELLRVMPLVFPEKAEEIKKHKKLIGKLDDLRNSTAHIPPSLQVYFERYKNAFNEHNLKELLDMFEELNEINKWIKDALIEMHGRRKGQSYIKIFGLSEKARTRPFPIKKFLSDYKAYKSVKTN